MYNSQKFPENTYMLGCPHFSHKNICRGVSEWGNKDVTRNFLNLEDMNRAILDSINSSVKYDDYLIILGDVIFGDKTKLGNILDRINCKNLYLVKGNHDKWMEKGFDVEDRFGWIESYKEIIINRQHIVLFHYPISIFNGIHKGSWNVCSHSHGTYFPSTKNCKDQGKVLDVGWDCFNKPLSFNEIKKIMDSKEYTPKDHHNKDTN